MGAFGVVVCFSSEFIQNAIGFLIRRCGGAEALLSGINAKFRDSCTLVYGAIVKAGCPRK